MRERLFGELQDLIWDALPSLNAADMDDARRIAALIRERFEPVLAALSPPEQVGGAPEEMLAAVNFVRMVARLSHTQDDGSSRDYDEPDADSETLNRLIGQAREINTMDLRRVLGEALAKAVLSPPPKPPADSGGGWRDIASAPKDGTWFRAYRHPCAPGDGFWQTVVDVTWDEEIGDFVWPDETYDPYFPPDLTERDGAGFFVHSPFEGRGSFTHWMPLPAAPTLKGEQL